MMIFDVNLVIQSPAWSPEKANELHVVLLALRNIRKVSIDDKPSSL